MKSTVCIVLFSLALANCGSPDSNNAAVPPAGNSPPVEQKVDIYATAVADPARSTGDRERDAGRQPAAVLAFVGITPGMQVLDLYSGGGYYAELLSRVVGPDGRVHAHNNEAYLGFAGDEIDARYAGNRLANVESLMAENNELALDADSFDAITMILTYHDFYLADPDNGWPAIDGAKLRAELFNGLKPGGVVGLVDHAAPDGAPTTTGGTTHRIDRAVVIEEMTAAGFVLEESSDLLRNPEDDRLKSAFDPSIRGNTDRFMLRFRKPG